VNVGHERGEFVVQVVVLEIVAAERSILAAE